MIEATDEKISEYHALKKAIHAEMQQAYPEAFDADGYCIDGAVSLMASIKFNRLWEAKNKEKQV